MNDEDSDSDFELSFDLNSAEKHILHKQPQIVENKLNTYINKKRKRDDEGHTSFDTHIALLRQQQQVKIQRNQIPTQQDSCVSRQKEEEEDEYLSSFEDSIEIKEAPEQWKEVLEQGQKKNSEKNFKKMILIILISKFSACN